MSRNFELLTQLDTIQENRPATISDAPQIAISEDGDWRPALRMNDPARIEIGRLVDKLFRLQPKTPRVVAFIGPKPRVGCSWLCARVAETLATRVREQVCVVDGNVHSPNLHRQFHIENHHGLTDALKGCEPMRNYARALSPSNLFIVSSGSMPSISQSKLVSDRMRERLIEMQQMFGYVLLDVASLDVSNDAIVLGRWADGVVLVLKANVSHREAAHRALQDFRVANVAVFGAVLNQWAFPVPSKLFNII